MSSQNFSNISDFDFLKEEITKGIDSITEELHSLPLAEIMNSTKKPDEILIDQLCSCCWVTCPFCSAVCTNTLEDHCPVDHSVTFHRSNAVNGWHKRGTDIMALEFCTSNVASNRKFYPDSNSDRSVAYKSHRTAGPKFTNGRITPDGSMLPYWKWFVCRFQTDLETYCKKKFQAGKIQSKWSKHTQADALKSLQ